MLQMFKHNDEIVNERLETDFDSSDALKEFGFVKGLFMSIRRILSCHPIKFLGGGSSLDFVPEKNKLKKENSNGQ